MWDLPCPSQYCWDFSPVKERRLRIVAFAAFSTASALALCIYTMPHYAAPATIAIYIFAIEGLRCLWQQGKTGEQAFVVAVCLTVVVATLFRQTGASAINSVFRLSRHTHLITRQLAVEPGKHLVLVSYDLSRHYPGNELVHNGADFGSEKILWARSKGIAADAGLCNAYSDRTFWSLTTNDKDTSLTRLELCK